MQARLIGETQHIKAGIKQFCEGVEMSLCAWNKGVQHE
jgi:hypothetical protein